MRKISLLICFVLFAGISQAQVFNTGEMMPKGKFSAGLEPTYLINSDHGTLFLFVHGNYGLKNDIGLNFQVGAGGYDTYAGGGINWGLSKNFSLSTGVHYFGYFGLDGRLNFTVPIKDDARIYSGLDAEVNFGTDVRVPLWVPVGVEIRLRDKLAFSLESEIAITAPAYHLVGAGVIFYF